MRLHKAEQEPNCLVKLWHSHFHILAIVLQKLYSTEVVAQLFDNLKKSFVVEKNLGKLAPRDELIVAVLQVVNDLKVRVR